MPREIRTELDLPLDIQQRLTQERLRRTELQTLRTQLALDEPQWDTLTAIQKLLVMRRVLRLINIERG